MAAVSVAKLRGTELIPCGFVGTEPAHRASQGCRSPLEAATEPQALLCRMGAVIVTLLSSRSADSSSQLLQHLREKPRSTASSTLHLRRHSCSLPWHAPCARPCASRDIFLCPQPWEPHPQKEEKDYDTHNS